MESTRSESRPTEFGRFRRVFLSRPLVVAGLIMVLAVLLAAVLAGVVAPYGPYDQDLAHALAPCSRAHLLGTDGVGRDTLSRIIFGSRITLAVGVVAVGIGALIGTAIGLAAGFFRGWLESLIMRLTDAVMSLPPLVLALVIAASLGSGVGNVMIAIGISLLPTFIRLAWAQTISVTENEYVLAARAGGARSTRILIRHVLPNCVSPIIVQVTMSMGGAILTEASLSFLGLGIEPPAPAWGAMVYDGYRYLTTHPVLALAPGLAVMILVFAFNMVGDGLRDALDPRLRGVL